MSVPIDMTPILVEHFAAAGNSRTAEQQLRFDLYTTKIMIDRCEHMHQHTFSCFKKSRHVANGDCRFEFPRPTCPETMLARPSSESSECGLKPKRVVPNQYINPSNATVTSLLNTNNDIKDIGLTGFTSNRSQYACKYAAKRQQATENVVGQAMAAMDSCKQHAQQDVSHTEQARKMITSISNGMSKSMEISSVLAAFYLIHDSSCYHNVKFRKCPLWLMLKMFGADVIQQSANGSTESEPSTPDTVPCTMQAILQRGINPINAQSIVRAYFLPSNDVCDYIFRPRYEPFESMCFGTFVANVRKVRREKDKPLQDAAPELPAGMEPDDMRNFTMRHQFIEGHQQRNTHCLQFTDEHIPDVMGPRFPRADSTDEADRELLAKMTLLLFYSFRERSDLLGDSPSWVAACASKKVSDDPAVASKWHPKRDVLLAHRQEYWYTKDRENEQCREQRDAGHGGDGDDSDEYDRTYDYNHLFCYISVEC